MLNCTLGNWSQAGGGYPTGRSSNGTGARSSGKPLLSSLPSQAQSCSTPSQFGIWQDTGVSTKNIPIERIVEDPFFKRSDQSYFVQLADLCAYALLRRERPLESKVKYGIDRVFAVLSSVLVREASARDAEGIIRP